MYLYKNDVPIYAMAIINPQLNKKLSIQVEVEQRNEGPIPHVHVYLDKERNSKNCAYVRLDIPEYLPNHDSKKLNGKKLEEFIEIMKTTWGKYFIESNSGNIKKATGYEAAVVIWQDTFGNTAGIILDQDGYPIIPDYNLLNK